MMTFSEALREMKQGRRLHRRGWNGEHQFVCIAHPDKTMAWPTQPTLLMVTALGEKVAWLASQSDLLGEDWRYRDDRELTEEQIAALRTHG